MKIELKKGTLKLFGLGFAVLVAAALLLLPSTASPDAPPAPLQDARQPPPEPNQPTGTKVGERLPDFTVDTISGQSLTLSELRGKPVIVQGFASWCATCALDAQTISRVYPEYPDTHVVSLDIQKGETPQQIRQFIKNALGGYPGEEWAWALYKPGIVQTLAILTLDTTFVLDRQGKIVYKDLGITQDKDLHQALQQAA